MLKLKYLCRIMYKMSAYRRDFDETKYMYFLIKYDELLEKYNKIWKKVKNTIDKEFDSDPVYNEKFLKAKINLIMEKSTQIFSKIKSQKKVLNVFAYQ